MMQFVSCVKKLVLMAISVPGNAGMIGKWITFLTQKNSLGFGV